MRKHWLGASINGSALLIGGSALLFGVIALGGCGSSTTETKTEAPAAASYPAAFQAGLKRIDDGPTEFRYQLYSDGLGHVRVDRYYAREGDTIKLLETHNFDLKTNQEVIWDTEKHSRSDQALDPDRLEWFYTQKHKDNLLASGWKQIGTGPVNERPSVGFRSDSTDANPNEVWVDTELNFPTKTVSSRRDRAGTMDLFFFSTNPLDSSVFVTTMDPVVVQLTEPPKPQEQTTTGAATGAATGTDTSASTSTETSTGTKPEEEGTGEEKSTGESKEESKGETKEETKEETKVETKVETKKSTEAPKKEETSKKPPAKSSEKSAK